MIRHIRFWLGGRIFALGSRLGFLVMGKQTADWFATRLIRDLHGEFYGVDIDREQTKP